MFAELHAMLDCLWVARFVGMVTKVTNQIALALRSIQIHNVARNDP
jgi:hypothetical protein